MAAAPTRAHVLASHVERDAIGGPFLRPGIREPVEADRVTVVRTAVRQREGAERRFQRADEGSAHPLRVVLPEPRACS